MVARFVRDEEVVGSNPATPTTRTSASLLVRRPRRKGKRPPGRIPRPRRKPMSLLMRLPTRRGGRKAEDLSIPTKEPSLTPTSWTFREVGFCLFLLEFVAVRASFGSLYKLGPSGAGTTASHCRLDVTPPSRAHVRLPSSPSSTLAVPHHRSCERGRRNGQGILMRSTRRGARDAGRRPRCSPIPEQCAPRAVRALMRRPTTQLLTRDRRIGRLSSDNC